MGGGGGGGVVVRELVNQWAPRVQVRILPATFFIVTGLFSHIFLLVQLALYNNDPSFFVFSLRQIVQKSHYKIVLPVIMLWPMHVVSD